MLQKVAAWREREARSRNVPRGRILKDDALYEIAQQQPKDAEALARLRTIPKGWERSAAGTAIIEAVNAALELPKTDMPQLPRQNQAPEGAQRRRRDAQGAVEADRRKTGRRRQDHRQHATTSSGSPPRANRPMSAH